MVIIHANFRTKKVTNTQEFITAKEIAEEAVKSLEHPFVAINRIITCYRERGYNASKINGNKDGLAFHLMIQKYHFNENETTAFTEEVMDEYKKLRKDRVHEETVSAIQALMMRRSDPDIG